MNSVSPWLGRIPEDWVESRFRYEAVITGGQVDPRAEPWSGMVLIAPNHIESGTGRLLGRETAAAQGADSGKYVATAGQVLYSKIRPALNKVAIAVEDCLCSADMYAISMSDRLDTRFARYFMSAKPFHDFATAMSMRVKMPKVNREELADGPWLVPPLPEQRAIADFLDRETARIDTLIEEQQRLIEMLRERRVSEIAAEFAGAATTPLRQVIEYAQTGPFGTQLTADEYVDGGVPVINPTHIRRGVIVPDDSTTVTPEKAEDLARYRLAVGDIVLGRKGEVDKSALVDRQSAGYVCGSDAMALRPNSGTVADYLWWFLQSAVAHSQLELWSVGATVSGLNQTTIRKVRLPLPDEQEQRRIASYLYEKTAKIDMLMAETERFIEFARERRSALITAAVTGQIDVREAP